MAIALDTLKEFVRQPTRQNQAEDTVCLHVMHSIRKQRFIEIRVDLHSRCTCSFMTMTTIKSVTCLRIFDHWVITPLMTGGWLEDTSLVEKYTISEDAYNKREDTYRKYRLKKLAEDPTWSLAKEIAIRKVKHMLHLR